MGRKSRYFEVADKLTDSTLDIVRARSMKEAVNKSAKRKSLPNIVHVYPVKITKEKNSKNKSFSWF